MEDVTNKAREMFEEQGEEDERRWGSHIRGQTWEEKNEKGAAVDFTLKLLGECMCM